MQNNETIREQAEAFLAECSWWDVCDGDEELTITMTEGAEQQERERQERIERQQREMEAAFEEEMRRIEEPPPVQIDADRW